MDGPLPNPYDINWAPGIAMATHITILHEAMMLHAQDPLSEFNDISNRTRRLLWSLPLEAPWHEFRLRYNHFMHTGDPGEDQERFHVLGPWTVVTRELLLREEFMLRDLSYHILPRIFPALPRQPPILPPPPPPPQGPPPSPPQFPEPNPPASPPQVASEISVHSAQGLMSSDEVGNDQDLPEIIVISSDDEGNAGNQGEIGPAQGQEANNEEENLEDSDPEEEENFEDSDPEEEESSSDPGYDPSQNC